LRPRKGGRVRRSSRDRNAYQEREQPTTSSVVRHLTTPYKKESRWKERTEDQRSIPRKREDGLGRGHRGAKLCLLKKKMTQQRLGLQTRDPSRREGGKGRRRGLRVPSGNRKEGLAHRHSTTRQRTRKENRRTVLTILRGREICS